MHHWQRICELCGISFDVARLGRADDFVGEYVYFDGLCQHWSGCTVPAAVHGRGEVKQEEHIAGHNCICSYKYSAHRISLAKMKGCWTVQWLVPKDVDWMPESDDEDFETDGKAFLTGIGDGRRPRAPLENSYPVRHGIAGIELYVKCPNRISKIGKFADRCRPSRS